MEVETQDIGLNFLKWAKWKRELLIHGSYHPDDWNLLNSYQKQWTADTLNTLKALEKDMQEESD